jgi:hypothetical protein
MQERHIADSDRRLERRCERCEGLIELGIGIALDVIAALAGAQVQRPLEGVVDELRAQRVVPGAQRCGGSCGVVRLRAADRGEHRRGQRHHDLHQRPAHGISA